MPEESTRTIRNIPFHNFLSTYANNVAVQSNFFDVSMTFGEMLSQDEGVLTVEQRVKVTMTWAHAKIYLATLVDQLEKYENTFGPVSIPAQAFPPEVLKMLRGFSNEGEQGSIRHPASEVDENAT